MIIDVNPEFGYEIAISIPYAYWLHENDQLDGVVTCKGMKPFYYFCDNVEEKYNTRNVDNTRNGVQNLPNTWIHHNTMPHFGKTYGELTDKEKEKAHAWLDYSKWKCPPFKDYYLDDDLDLPDKYVVISNSYNLEHGDPPIGYFDIKCLYEIFNYLTDEGYSIIYKRPRNTEFATDMNELQNLDIQEEVDGYGWMTDFQLTDHYKNVILMDDIVSKYNLTYNEAQLKIYAKSSGFMSRGGGSSILCACFGKPVIIYINASGDKRPGYFDENSYFRKLAGSPIYPVIDLKKDILERGYRDYSGIYENMRSVF